MKLKKALALLLAFCLIVPSPLTSRAEESSEEKTVQSENSEDVAQDEQKNVNDASDTTGTKSPETEKIDVTVKPEAPTDNESKENVSEDAAEDQKNSSSDQGQSTNVVDTSSVQSTGVVETSSIEGVYAAQAPSVQATGAVQVGDKYYDTVEAAIKATSDEVTITLQQDLEEDVVIPSGKTVTLDLNGHHITNVSDNTITNKGTLTVKNSGDDSNGYVDNVTHQKAAVYNEAGATATLSGGYYVRSKEAGNSFDSDGGNSYYTVLNQGTMTINGTASVSNRGVFSSCVENGWYTPAENTTGASATLTIDGTAEIYGGKYAVKNDDYGILNIKSGSISTGGAVLILNWNQATIEGGKLEIDNTGTCGIYNGATEGLDYETGKLTITGGTFTGIYGKSATLLKTATNQGKISVSGGNFWEKFDESFLAEGYAFEKSYDTGYDVVKIDQQAVAQIGDKTYSTLENAIGAANDGDTITILQDLTTKEGIFCWSNLTIDLNGKKITVAGENGLVSGNLTIKDSVGNGTIESTKSLNVSGKDAKIILESGTINVSNDYGIYAQNGGTVEINGGTVTSLYASLTGNNTTGNMNFTVNGGTLTAQQGPAIYMPGQTNLTVTGGTLNGGISLRMGTVKIFGGTINAVTKDIDAPKDYYNYSGNAWFPDALYVFGGTYTSDSGNNLDLQITGGTFNCSNGQGSAVAIYDLGKVAQNMSVAISGNAGLYTSASSRRAYQVLNLNDIGVTSPETGFGTNSGNVLSALSGGYYSTDIDTTYIVKEYECVKGSYPVNGKTYTYAIAKEGTLAAVEATPGKADAKVADTIKPADKDKAKDIAASATVTTKGSRAMVESVNSVVKSLAENHDETEAAAKKALDNAHITVTGETITTVVEPYFKTEAKEIAGDDGKKIVTLEISLYYQVKATIDPDNMDETNTAVIGSPVKVTDADTVGKEIEIQVKVPKEYFTTDKDLFARHEKEDGSVYYHKVTLTPAAAGENEATLTFTNDKGFSPFTFAYVTKKATVAYEGGSTENYAPGDVTTKALPTVSKAGATFKGWSFSCGTSSISGVYSGVLTDDLFTKLDTLGGSGTNTIKASAQWENSTTGGSTSSGSSSHRHKSSSSRDSAATATATSTVVTVSGAKTGDNANIALWVVLIVLAGAGAAGILLYEKKRKRC